MLLEYPDHLVLHHLAHNPDMPISVSGTDLRLGWHVCLRERHTKGARHFPTCYFGHGATAQEAIQDALTPKAPRPRATLSITLADLGL